MQLKRVTKETWGQSPQPLGDFYVLAAKNSNFNAVSINFERVLVLGMITAN